MKKVLMFVAFTTMVLAAVLETEAATARVRCRVETGRLRIQVDGQDLSRGTYRATVKNARTAQIVRTEPNKVKTVTIAPDDIDLDFDSTAQSNDLDSFVSTGFARVGDTVRAKVINAKTGVIVAAASNTCIAK